MWIIQIILVALFSYTIWCDKPWRPTTMSVGRSDDTVAMYRKFTGAVIAIIVTIVNKSVFDDSVGWRHYSAIVNLIDLTAIVYVCLISVEGRNFINNMNIRLRQENR